MAEKHTLQIERTLDASRTSVWRCWTEPKLLKQWFCPKPWYVSEADFDLRAGGRMNTVMEGPDGERVENRGIWLEVTPQERLVFTDTFTEDFHPVEDTFMTSFVLLSDAVDGRTRMIWGARHKSEEDLEKHLSMGFEGGWNAAVDQLNELAHQLDRTQAKSETLERKGPSSPSSVRTCLWFDNRGEEAASFYVSLIPNSFIETITRPESTQEALIIEFVLDGAPYMIVNGGPTYKLSPALSISVLTDDQDQTDRIWKSLIATGGSESMCGWLTDGYGVAWQITPRVLPQLLYSVDKEVSKRVNDAMMTMRKIDIAQLKQAAKTPE